MREERDVPRREFRRLGVLAGEVGIWKVGVKEGEGREGDDELLSVRSDFDVRTGKDSWCERV